MIPAIIKNFNVFVDGVSMIGVAEEITLPKLGRKTEDFEAGGMGGPIELDLGQEKLEMGMTFKGWNKDVLKQYGVFAADGVPLRFRGAQRSDDADANTDAIEISVRGKFKELDFGSTKKGEANSLKITMPLTAFKYEINGEPLIDLDLINNIFVVDGEDRMADERKALGI